MTTLTGYLLARPSAENLTRDSFEIRGAAGRPAPILSFEKTVYQLTQWEEFKFLSTVPLADERIRGILTDGPFPYRVFCVRSGRKVLILSERRKVTDYLLDRILHRRIYPNLRKVGFHIDSLINSCRSPDSEYRITALFGRYSGSERQLTSIILFGDDITESTLFREQQHLFTFYSCGVGRRLYDALPRLSAADDDGQIIRLGTDGSVSLILAGRSKAREAMGVIAHVTQNRWVDDVDLVL